VTASDLMLIWPEKQGWPQYIGALVALDGKVLFDADGRFLIEPVRDAIGRMLHLAPRFRQVLYWPRPGLGWPVWVDAQSFDIAEHVRVHPVPPPGDERQLLLACETPPPPPVAPGSAVVGDVVVDRPAGRARGVVHEDAPRHR
jgi:diacylglycerol O-acyltransferase / wax synthase